MRASDVQKGNAGGLAGSFAQNAIRPNSHWPLTYSWIIILFKLRPEVG